jgi:hypothetical protein
VRLREYSLFIFPISIVSFYMNPYASIGTTLVNQVRRMKSVEM